MEEAYTIGIRLALEDGVSAGVAAMSAQMSALDRAVAGSLAGMAALRSAAAAASPVLARGAGSKDVPASAEVPTGEPSAHGVTAKSREMAAEPTRAVPAPVLPQSEPDMHAPVRTVRAPAELPSLTPHRPSASEMSIAPPPAVPVPTSPPPLPPIFPRLLELPDVPVAPMRLPALPPIPDHAGAFPKRGRGADAERTAEGAATPQLPPTDAALSAFAAPLPRENIEPGRATASSPGVASGVPQALPPAAVPEQSERGEGVAGGDVYLDGARLGRWMFDRLAREASRPHGAGVAFDSRMSPAWSANI